jgi:hypothetical protein
MPGCSRTEILTVILHYSSKEVYVAAVDGLAANRYLLRENADRLLAEAEREAIWLTPFVGRIPRNAACRVTMCVM